jgi:hypothetical protein
MGRNLSTTELLIDVVAAEIKCGEEKKERISDEYYHYEMA